ncbi:hypothetical protein GGF42_003773 [Coemansia sp. RSA 2424]|nr:hypothetical protein GGF42_003773 [Coemansia sp. RSA 2424]
MYGASKLTAANVMNSSWGASANTPNGRRRRNGQGTKNSIATLTMSSLGVAGGLLAGKAFAGGKDKPSRPPKDVVQNHPAQVEPNYAQYTHGSKFNAQPQPVAYNAFKGSSVIAQAGSSKASSSQPSHPQQHQPHWPHAHTTSGPQSHGAASSTHAAAGSGTSSSNSSGISVGGPSSDIKHAKQQWTNYNQPASAAMNSSYQAFDNSAGGHPLTSSVLAFNPAVQNQAHQQVRPGPRRQDAQPVAGQGVPNSYTASGAKHSLPSTAWAHDMPAMDASYSAATAMANHKQKRQSTVAPAAVTQSELEVDMGSAGFMPMHSQYNANKHNNTGLNGRPAQAQQQQASSLHYSQAPHPSTVAYQPQPQPQPQQNNYPGPVYQQHQQQHQQHYGPQPIPVPTQAPAVHYGYGGYAPPIAHSYSTQPTELVHTQSSVAGYGGLSQMQHQQNPLASMSQSVPATYNAYNQPQGLAASYQNATYSSPQLMHPSSDVAANLRPKKHVHFADYS